MPISVFIWSNEDTVECAPRSQNKSFRSYVKSTAKGIVRLAASTGGNFNFWRSGKLLKEIADGKNVFHIEQGTGRCASFIKRCGNGWRYCRFTL